MVNREFARWATGFSGFDGGNPEGSVWLCGLEMGCKTTPKNLIFDDVSLPPYVGGEYWPNRAEFLDSQYNLKATKLLAALSGKGTAEYASFFREQACFDQDSSYFKLNLYPLGFKNTARDQWEDWLAEKTGFPTKKQYLEWCRVNRFPMFRKWLLRYSPGLVICTGISYVEQLKLAFSSGNDETFTEESAGKYIKYFITNNNQTLVAIIYFLGTRYGLKSDKALLLTGQTLCRLKNKFIGG